MNPCLKRFELVSQCEQADSRLDPLYQPSLLSTLCSVDDCPLFPPLTAHESELLESVFLMLEGLTSPHFVRRAEGFELKNVRLSHLTYGALDNLLTPVRQLANKLQFIKAAASPLAAAKSLILQHLGSVALAAVNQIRKFAQQLQRQFYCQSGVCAETQTKATLTVMGLVDCLERKAYSLQILLTIFNSLNFEERAAQVSFLNLLQRKLIELQTEEAHAAEVQFLLQLHSECVQIYMRFIFKRLQRKTFDDSYSQFMLEEDLSIREDCKRQLVPDLLAPYLHRIRDCFLSLTAFQKIFNPQDYQLLFLRLGVKELELAFGKTFRSSKVKNSPPGRKRFQLRLESRAKPAEMEQESEDNPFGMFSIRCRAFNFNPLLQQKGELPVIEDCPGKVSDSSRVYQYKGKVDFALDSLVRGLEDRIYQVFIVGQGGSSQFRNRLDLCLQKFKQFCLMGAGAFWCHFLQRATEELQKHSREIAFSSLQSKLQYSARVYRLSCFEGQLSVEIGRGEGRGWDVVKFVLLKDAVMTGLFQRECQTYNKVQGFLVRARRFQMLLSRNWVEHNKAILRHARSSLVSVQIYRMKLYQFVNALVNYSMITIERSWDRFKAEVGKASSLRAITKAHQSFIRGLIDQLLLDPQRSSMYDIVYRCFFKVQTYKVAIDFILSELQAGDSPSSPDCRQRIGGLQRQEAAFDDQLAQLLSLLEEETMYKELVLGLRFNRM